MKVIFAGIYYLFVACIVAVALMLVATMVPFGGGLKIKVVKSGSMEPTIRTGAVVVIKPSPDYVVGDIITFGPDTKEQIPTTHRIVEKSEGLNPIFTTKGDANDSIDPANTRISDIHGKVIANIPYLGFVLDFARKPLGFALIVGLPALLIILEEIGKIIAEIKAMRKKKSVSRTTDTTLPPRPMPQASEAQKDQHEKPRTIQPTRLR